ncbi:MAG: site-specific integrase [Rickettsiales bacterium]|nr:site-specific integrase [Rickettsiales bacterium]
MRGQPKLYQYKDGRSPFWFIRYYDGVRTRTVSTGYRIGAQDKEANHALAAFTLERERPVARTSEDMPIAQALADYDAEHAIHTASHNRFVYHRAALEAFYGLRSISFLTKDALTQYIINRKAAGMAIGTIRREMQMLKAALNHQVEAGRLISCPKISLPPAPRPKQRWLTPEEARQLLGACQSVHVYAFILLALNTGQRRAAIENLTWFQVDFKNRLIDFRRDAETSKVSGVVPMNDLLHDLLHDMFQHKECGHVLSYRGRPSGDVHAAFDRTVNNADLENVTPHTLRHTFATWAAMGGAPMHHIARIMGHASTQTTEHHYAKYAPDYMGSTMKTVELLLKSDKTAKVNER